MVQAKLHPMTTIQKGIQGPGKVSTAGALSCFLFYLLPNQFFPILGLFISPRINFEGKKKFFCNQSIQGFSEKEQLHLVFTVVQRQKKKSSKICTPLFLHFRLVPADIGILFPDIQQQEVDQHDINTQGDGESKWHEGDQHGLGHSGPLLLYTVPLHQ